MKIYNKKKFSVGIVFLFLAVLLGVGTFLNAPKRDFIRIAESIVLIIISLCISSVSIRRSLNKKCTEIDIKENDEREQLLDIKAKSTAFKSSFSICFVIMIALIITMALTKNIMFMAMLVGVGLVPLIMIISEIVSYIYHDSRN